MNKTLLIYTTVMVYSAKARCNFPTELSTILNINADIPLQDPSLSGTSLVIQNS